jgi:HSP20 family protein
MIFLKTGTTKEVTMTTLVRWEPFRELAQLQGEMGRFVNGLLEGQSRGNQSWVPALDVWETENDLVYAFDLPGLTEDQISIEVQDDTLTISGQREKTTTEQGDRFYRFERRYGSFARAVGLPAGVDDSKIEASYENGVLELRVPKPEEAKPRRIQLGSARPDLERTTSAN